MKKLIITVALAVTMAGTAIAGEKIQPKYITECRVFNRDGSTLICDTKPNPQHVAPDTKWSFKRLQRAGLPPIKAEGSK